MESYGKPRTKPLNEEKEMEKNHTFYNPMDSKAMMMTGGRDFKKDLRRIYKSKIAQVPTPGYAGHTSVFHKPISYLNYDKIIEQEKKEDEIKHYLGDDLSDGFRNSLSIKKPDVELPYVVGYKGFRVGVKARNYHGENFHDSSLKARNEAKFLNEC